MAVLGFGFMGAAALAGAISPMLCVLACVEKDDMAAMGQARGTRGPAIDPRGRDSIEEMVICLGVSGCNSLPALVFLRIGGLGEGHGQASKGFLWIRVKVLCQKQF